LPQLYPSLALRAHVAAKVALFKTRGLLKSVPVSLFQLVVIRPFTTWLSDLL
jgi:hypothetical protein